MRIGIITDVHANTEALGEVLESLRQDQVSAIVHLGDVVGYGAEPNECCDILRKEAQLSLMGNHDAAVLGIMGTAWFARHARLAVEWSARILRDDNREWLNRSPATYREGPYLFSHGSPVAPEEYRYVLSQFEADEILAWTAKHHPGVRVVLVGHAHQCLAFGDDGSCRVIDGTTEKTLDLSKGRWVVNVGSVGQPRDGDPRACYALLDTDSGAFETRRVAYDFVTTGAKIRAAQLPEILSTRLALGR